MVDRDEGVRVPRLGLALPDPRTGTAGSDPFERLSSLAAAAEASAFDSVWVRDGPPPLGVVRPEPDRLFEPYSLLGALAVRTGRVGLAVLPDGPTARPPSIVAKLATTIDVISHGRVALGLGAGGPEDPDAADRLAEELRICRALLVEETPTFVGVHHRIVDAPNRPRPVRPSGPALVVAARRPEVLDPVARYADALVVDGAPNEVARLSRALAERCESVGRPRDGLVLLWSGTLAPAGGGDAARWAEGIAALAAAGAEGFVVGLAEGVGADPGAVTRVGEVLAGTVPATG